MPKKIPLKLLVLRAVLCLCGLAALGTVLMLGITTFTGGPRFSYQVIGRAPAPSGQVVAVLTRVTSGKADDFGYLVDVNATGPDGDSERVANLYAAHRSNSETGLDMIWRDDHTLELRYLSATEAQIDQSDVTVAGQHLTVALKPQH
jgi:hypothetical protein